MALEFGYIHVYRAGWNVNTAPLVANMALACALLFVGYLFFHGTLSLRQFIGAVVCVGDSYSSPIDNFVTVFSYSPEYLKEFVMIC